MNQKNNVNSGNDTKVCLHCADVVIGGLGLELQASRAVRRNRDRINCDRLAKDRSRIFQEEEQGRKQKAAGNISELVHACLVSGQRVFVKSTTCAEPENQKRTAHFLVAAAGFWAENRAALRAGMEFYVNRNQP
jgi:hypothetical protein